MTKTEKNTIKPTLSAGPKEQTGIPDTAKPAKPLEDDDDFDESLDDIDYENIDFDDEDDF